MDRKTFQTVAANVIQNHAKGVPAELREDFVQDMWVHLLEHDLFGRFDEARGSLNGFLDVCIFRVRANWLESVKRGERFVSSDPAGLDQLEATYDPLNEGLERAEITDSANEAVETLLNELPRKYSGTQVTMILKGLEEGVSKKDLAAALGVSPQLFQVPFIKIRKDLKAA